MNFIHAQIWCHSKYNTTWILVQFLEATFSVRLSTIICRLDSVSTVDILAPLRDKPGHNAMRLFVCSFPWLPHTWKTSRLGRVGVAYSNGSKVPFLFTRKALVLTGSVSDNEVPQTPPTSFWGASAVLRSLDNFERYESLPDTVYVWEKPYEIIYIFMPFRAVGLPNWPHFYWNLFRILQTLSRA